MVSLIQQFHLAIPAINLEASRSFYVDVLGAREGRSTHNHVDLDFFGHHLVLHQAPPGWSATARSFDSDFHGEIVPIPHLGLNLDQGAWAALAERIKGHAHRFSDPPHIRMKGEPGEHATMFLLDPTGNALEFKAFKNHDEVFSRIFAGPSSQAALESIVANAAPAQHQATPRPS